MLSVANTLKSYGKDLWKGNLGDMLQPIQPTLLHSPHFSKNRLGDQPLQDYAGLISPGICRSWVWASVLRSLISIYLSLSWRIHKLHRVAVPAQNGLFLSGTSPGLVSFCSVQCSHGNLGHSYQIIYRVWTCYCYPGTCQGVPTCFTEDEKQFILLALVTPQTSVFHRDPYPLMTVGATY